MGVANRVVLVTTVCWAASGWSMPALGQSADSSQTTRADSGALQEVVVTAQRRAENLQKVPLTVTAMSSDQLQNNGIVNSNELGQVTPGLQIRQDVFATLPSIRGVGSSFYGPAFENPVAVYVDGIYLASSSGLDTSLANIDHIEVLKGPQGTLFGRNSTGGLIQVLTAAPKHEFEGKASINYGNFNTGGADLYLTGGLSDTLAADIAIHDEQQGRGYGQNLFSGNDTNRENNDISLRSKLVWTPDDLTTVSLAASYSYRDGSSIFSLGVRSGQSVYDSLYQALFHAPPVNFGGFYDINQTVDPYSRITTWGTALTAQRDVGFAYLKSITSFQGTTFDSHNKLDQVPYTFVTLQNGSLFSRPFSEEVQLASKGEGKLEWTAGLFYYHARDGWDPLDVELGKDGATLLLGSPVYPVGSATYDAIVTDSNAAYAQATYEFVPGTRLTLGGRYTYETRSISGGVVTLVGGAALGTTPVPTPDLGIPSNISFNNFSYRVALEQDLTADVLGYVSFSTGFKSGSYNATTPSNPPFSPEKIGAAEVGLKTELFDHRLRLNPAIYYYKYTNIQVGVYNATSELVANAAAARIYGADLDAEWRATDDLSINGGASYIHDRFIDYPDAPYTYEVPGCVPAAAPNAADICQGSANGKRLPNTPDYTAYLGVNWTHGFAFGKIGVNTNIYHSSRWYGLVDNNPLLSQKAYDLLNTTISWTPAGSNFKLSVWGKNILGQEVSNTQIISGGGSGYTVMAPATYGGRVDFSF
jgi:iron complex outermembrane receptor protein